MSVCPMEECVAFEETRTHTGCRRKVRCGLMRGVSMLLGRQPDVEALVCDLEVEDAFNGFPEWVITQAWVHFTPQEQAVLKRWRRMHDVKLAMYWDTAQAQRNRR